MIRLICKELAMDYDGKTHSSIKTFDVEFPEVEKYLSEKVGYADSGSRHIIGEEIIDHLPQEEEETCGISTINNSKTYGCPHCGRPIRKVEPAKEVPDIRPILERFQYDGDGNKLFPNEAINQAIQEISALYRKEGGL